MALGETDTKKIINFVKKEPRTVQEISRLINKSWVTTDKYINDIKKRTGLVNIKVFRKGTQGALKLVYYPLIDSLLEDDIKEDLYNQIKSGRKKTDFDVMDIFQFVPESRKRSFLEIYKESYQSENQKIIPLFQQAEQVLYCFSGNISFINIKEKDIKVIDILEELLKRGVMIKILCRIHIASLTNIKKIQKLMQKYPGLIEIKHRYHPLRGFIVDDKIARLKVEEPYNLYKSGELQENTRIFYDIKDLEWVLWLQKVFWNLYRSSIEYSSRLTELEKIK
ncbi:MAG: hypothetical protein V1740_01635 [Candidatus Woesearchaeota archaeon]